MIKNKCPFCNSVENRTISVKDSWTEAKNFRVVCESCDAMGPAADTPELAEKFWNGLLKKDSAFKQYIIGENLNEEYQISDFKGLKKEANMFYPFNIIDVRRDPEYGYENVYLMLIEFIDSKFNKEENKFGLCIYDTEKEKFIEEPAFLWEYNITPEELYKKYGFIVPGYDEDELHDSIYEEGGVSSPMSTLTNTPGMGNVQPAQGNGIGSGDSWGDGPMYDQKGKVTKSKRKSKKIDARKKKKMNESNLNPYDKIGAMMAKKMGVAQPFKKGDSKTNTIIQNTWEELDENQPENVMDIDTYVNNPDEVLNNAKKRTTGKIKEEKYSIPTLDSYAKAATHIPAHSLEDRENKKNKKINEEKLRDVEALKDVKAKEAMTNLGIAYEFKPGKSGKNRVFIKTPMKDVLDKLKEGGWDEQGKNPENTVRKYKKGDKILTIFAEGKDFPRVILTTETDIDIKENIKIKKLVSGSLNPYIK